MQRYFVNAKEDDLFVIGDADSYHINKVMRMKKNDKIEIVYDNREYICEICNLAPRVKCRIISLLEEKNKTTPRIIIAQSLVKEQKMDYILQKATELGCDVIVPVVMERSIVKLQDRKDKKITRWQKVVKEASEQSKRCKMPEIEDVVSLKDLKDIDCTYKFFCSVNEKRKTIKSVLSKVNISDTILFVVGPEGGFSKEEEIYLMEEGFESISLGANVLRTETASLFVLSAVDYQFMR